ncbi:putative protein [Candidatus Protofrankia californiensis]|uniref:HAD-superfamily hydrolase n=1 Tax=Candidatus Protofrankia californiensis TaxID=1839754 RepID=A0A1C3NYP3_9ACTN|nr:putative protein [Candidatus Protofrankia californiensis]
MTAGAEGAAAGHVRAVWTDFGGVLTPSAAASTRAYSDLVGVPVAILQQVIVRVTATYGTDDPMLPLDTPLVTEDEWTRQVEQVLARDFALDVKLGDFGEGWFRDRPVDTQWLSVLRDLRAAGFFVGMLSNMVPTWERHWRAMVPSTEVFDHIVVSHEVGFRKPMRQIYDLAALAAGVEAGQCVLVDDMPGNCAGAEASGWHAIRFTDAAEAARQLSPLVGIELVAPAGRTRHDDRPWVAVRHA